MTVAQERALADLWPHFGIDFHGDKLDLNSVFARSARCALEIGFGMGATLAEMAGQSPDWNYLGIEVHRPGVGNLLRLLSERALGNVRIICADAVEVLNTAISDDALDAVYIFFPDPWPKKRHHKRRLIQPEFVSLIGKKLRTGGLLHIATDWDEYAQHILSVLESTPLFSNLHEKGCFAPGRGARPLTKFEQRGLRLGHGVWDVQFRKS